MLMHFLLVCKNLWNILPQKKTWCQSNEMPIMCIVDNYIINKQCSFLWNSFVYCCNLFCQYEIKKKKNTVDCFILNVEY